MIFRCRQPLSALAPLRVPAALWLATAACLAAATPATQETAAEHPAVKATEPAPALTTPTKPVLTGLATPEEEIRGLLTLGGRLADRGQFDAADIAFRQVLGSPRVKPAEERAALLGLAQLHRKHGQLTKAAAIYERFLKEHADAEETPEAMLALGRILRALGTHKLAIARFYSVLNSTLKVSGEGLERYQLLAKTAQFEIAETHFQAGNFAEANKFFSRLRLLDLAPADRARAHFKAGYALRLQGNHEGAVSTLRSYLEQWPEDENVPEARYMVATSLRELKRTQEALAATLELLRSEKSHKEDDAKRWAYWQRKTGNQLANDFYDAGDSTNARTIYSGLLALSPELSWRLPITYQIALCDERLGLPERARLAYDSIIKATEDNAPADLTELANMAKWRIQHLEWRDRVSQQLSKALESPATKSAAVPAPPRTPTAIP
ncbi:MAG: tetratricopeptide repeat protein [Opitutaceae bacterium]|nr:tetratricopeptide repeat protein [Opitutaceae bacterium]